MKSYLDGPTLKDVSIDYMCNLQLYILLHMDCQLTISWSSVRFGAAATAFLHKLQKGIPPWVPLKGHEKKTYKQLQEEAIESKRRDLAVLEANDGIWPGVKIPSHALFLWASGSELTSLLGEDHMPNKYIPKDLRYVYAADISHFLVSFTSNWCKISSISILRGSNFWRLYFMSLVPSFRKGFSLSSG